MSTGVLASTKQAEILLRDLGGTTSHTLQGASVVKGAAPSGDGSVMPACTRPACCASSSVVEHPLVSLSVRCVFVSVTWIKSLTLGRRAPHSVEPKPKCQE